jgi:hypothetical protein
VLRHRLTRSCHQEAYTFTSVSPNAQAVGAVAAHLAHLLDEFAEMSSIEPGIKSLLALAVSMTTH